MNNIFISGYVSSDPKFYDSGENGITKFSLGYYDKNKDKTTSYINVTFFKKINLERNMKVVVVGRLHQDSYADGDGNVKYNTSIIGNSIDIINKDHNIISTSSGGGSSAFSSSFNEEDIPF